MSQQIGEVGSGTLKQEPFFQWIVFPKEKIDRQVSNIDELNSLKDEVSQLKQLVKKLVEDN